MQTNHKLVQGLNPTQNMSKSREKGIPLNVRLSDGGNKT
jgi:hypothetical protein